MRKDVKDMINKRKIAYIYLLHRMFEGSPALLLKIMKIPNVKIEDIQDWDKVYREAVYDTIREEDARGVEMGDPHADVPSIKSLKEKILRQVELVISETTDPARLASAYKVLSEFEVSDDRKDKSVLDAINDIVAPKPGRPKKEAKTMLEKIRQEKYTPDAREESEEETNENDE